MTGAAGPVGLLSNPASGHNREQFDRVRARIAACPDIRHVILISIDTLRADHLACYGHPTVRSPHFDRLAAEGILFESAIAAAPTTLASHTSLLTGTFPHTHGTPRNSFVVNARNVTLAETLKQAGFSTAAFIGSFALHSRFGLGQGFDVYDQQFDLLEGPDRRHL